MYIAHAKWADWPHVGECYRVRTRGGKSAFSREGFVWTDSYGQAVDRPAATIKYHDGPKSRSVSRSRFSLNTPTRKKASDGQEHP